MNKSHPQRQGKQRPLTAKVFASGLTSALHRWPVVEFRSPLPLFSPPQVVSVGFGSTPLRVQSFPFADPPAHRQSISPPSSGRTAAQTAATGAAGEGQHRKQCHVHMRPPADTVKLHDRLFYVLQPPLESWFCTEQFDFPHQPFPFQLDGIAFLYPRHTAVLADVMGLGKTMQAITAMRMLVRAGEIRSILVICPKPLVSNWCREIGVWAPEIPFAVVQGSQAKRQFQWQRNDIPVRIANYELLIRDQECLAQIATPFDLVILDEAQRIKNRNSSTSRIAGSIPRQRSWALTGTPIENSSDDLLGIFEFVRPGQLSSSMTPRRMGKAAADHILRRTKEQVLTELPPKLFRDANVQLTAEQWRSYERAQAKGLVRLNDLGHELTIQHVFELVLRLKQICNFDPSTLQSAKLDRLEADLEEIAASGQKAIIFSQWVNTLKILQRKLSRFHPLAYHGKVPNRRRDDVLSRFRDGLDRHVILMSYGAGSVGLNLQFAGYVFLFDRWWNPAVEDQAINRAHRIGATGPVTVTRFLATGTIEERIDDVLRQKRALFETVLAAADHDKGLGLSRREIFGLFDLPLAPSLDEEKAA